MFTAVQLINPLTFVSLLLLASAVHSSREEVSFASRDGFQLEGTLRLPASASSTNHVPGVVLIHGSGPMSRDELIPAFGHQIPVFAEIGDALQGEGIAVLTYDKRICSSLNDCYNNSYPLLSEMNVTLDDLIDDALAAVRFMQSRSEINAIVAVGHSQAGTYIPIMLETEPEVIDGGAMLAGTFRPFDELALWQHNFNSQMMDLFGINASSCIPYWDLWPVGFEWIESIRDGVDVPEFPGLGESVDYWKSLFDVHSKAMAAAANIEQPLLILHGDMDWVVPPSDPEAWSDYLDEVGANYKTQILPCVTHFMNCIKRFPYEIGDEVDPQVTDSLTNFVLTATGTSGDIYIGWKPSVQILLVITAVAGFF